jgi:S-DNA-T family DNA segregation ATPase FtsK/SpoIIIE
MLGNGDMLFLMPGSPQLIRAQGVFVRDEEITKVVDSITSQAPPQYLITSFDQIQMAADSDEDEAEDTLFNEAKGIVLSTGNASTTFLQRKLKIGYARAASLMDMLEARGVVGPQEGARPRRVLFPKSGQSSDDDENDEF